MSTAGVGGEQLGAGGALLDHDAEHAGRDAGGVGGGAEDERRDRRERARPQDHRVAGHQGGHELLERHDDRAVVGRDRGDDADRLVAADAQRHPARARARRRGPGSAPRGASTGRGRSSAGPRPRPIVELRALGEAPGLAGLGDHRGDERRPSSPRRGRGSACRRRGPLGGRQVGPHPLVEGPSGLGDRPLDLGERRGADLGDDRSRRPGSRPRRSSSPSTQRPATYDRASVDQAQ